MRKWLQKRLHLRLPRKHQSRHLPSRSSPMEFIARSCLRSSWQDSTRVLTSRKRRWWCLSRKLWISSNYCFAKRTENTVLKQLCLCQCWNPRRGEGNVRLHLVQFQMDIGIDVSGLLYFNLIFYVARTMSWLHNSVSKNSWNYLGSSETSDQVHQGSMFRGYNCSWWTVDFLCSFLASVLGLKDHSYKARNGIIIDYFSGFLLYLVHPYAPSSLRTTSNQHLVIMIW